ncbi:uridine phosphorylase [Nocardioides maradonensis]
MSAHGRQHHIHLDASHSARYALLPSDPAHCEVIARHLDDAVPVGSNREFVSWRGSVGGVPVLVTSTGVGGPSTALAMEELHAIGVDTFVRVGVSLTFQPFVRTGDLAIATGSVRDEGTTRQYLPLEFPAVATHEVVAALRESAEQRDVRHHLGLTHTKDSFYGEVEPDRLPMRDQLNARLRMCAEAGVLCSEMEMATVLTVARALGARAGGVVMMWADDADPTDPPALDHLHAVCADGIRRLASTDGSRGERPARP